MEKTKCGNASCTATNSSVSDREGENEGSGLTVAEAKEVLVCISELACDVDLWNISVWQQICRKSGFGKHDPKQVRKIFWQKLSRNIKLYLPPDCTANRISAMKVWRIMQHQEGENSDVEEDDGSGVMGKYQEQEMQIQNPKTDGGKHIPKPNLNEVVAGRGSKEETRGCIAESNYHVRKRKVNVSANEDRSVSKKKLADSPQINPRKLKVKEKNNTAEPPAQTKQVVERSIEEKKLKCIKQIKEKGGRKKEVEVEKQETREDDNPGITDVNGKVHEPVSIGGKLTTDRGEFKNDDVLADCSKDAEKYSELLRDHEVKRRLKRLKAVWGLLTTARDEQRLTILRLVAGIWKALFSEMIGIAKRETVGSLSTIIFKQTKGMAAVDIGMVLCAGLYNQDEDKRMQRLTAGVMFVAELAEKALEKDEQGTSLQ